MRNRDYNFAELPLEFHDIQTKELLPHEFERILEELTNVGGTNYTMLIYGLLMAGYSIAEIATIAKITTRQVQLYLDDATKLKSRYEKQYSWMNCYLEEVNRHWTEHTTTKKFMVSKEIDAARIELENNGWETMIVDPQEHYKVVCIKNKREYILTQNKLLQFAKDGFTKYERVILRVKD